VANCQASVVACYASARGHTLVDRRLYVHEDWFADTAADRRTRCGVPADLAFQTRTALTWALIAGLRERGDLPFGWVTGDEHFGNTPVLLDRIADAGLAYFMEVPHNVRVWVARPPTAVPSATGKKGHPFTRLRLAPGAPAPVRVDALAAALPSAAWQVAQIQEGSKGPLVAEVAFVRAVAIRDGLPGPDVWVVFRRALDAGRELKAYRCNAAADTPPETLVWLLGLRGPVEQAIKEAKEELGLDHYEVRGWRGWHHHTTMTLLAQHFLVRLRSRLGGGDPGADRAPGAPPARRDPARPAARRGGDARLHPGGPTPQLCRRLLPPPAAAAPTPPEPGYLLREVTL
jgi:SRSO17 transposase